MHYTQREWADVTVRYGPNRQYEEHLSYPVEQTERCCGQDIVVLERGAEPQFHGTDRGFVAPSAQCGNCGAIHELDWRLPASGYGECDCPACREYKLALRERYGTARDAERELVRHD